MAASVDTQSPAHLNKVSSGVMGTSTLYSPSSDKRFWSNLRTQVVSILEDRSRKLSNGENFVEGVNIGDSDKEKRLKEDSQLLLRGFNSVAHTLSQLSNNIDDALQGARDLAKPPTMTEIFQTKLKEAECEEKESKEQQTEEETNKGVKRKFDPNESSDDAQKEKEPSPKDKKMKKAKNLAISMANKAASLARELESIQSDLCSMQERCTSLEEENRRLRDGFDEGIRPEEDDLVRLQMEALLAEKSRLANENANLVRENQCLHQLVEYHQIASQDLSESHEQVLQGMCLDFSSPSSAIAEDDGDYEAAQTPVTNLLRLSTSLEESFPEEKQ